MSGDPLSIAVGFVVFVFSIVVHENAHGIAAEYFGDPTARMMGRITLNPVSHIDPVGSILLPAVAMMSQVPFIGWAKPVPVNPANLRKPLVHNAYVAAAGPASNLLLALAGAILMIMVGLVFKHVPGLTVEGSRTALFFTTLCNNLILFNCVLAIFNLVPIPPLDGHWILIRFLPPGPREAIASVGRFGFIILIALLWSGILWKIISGPLLLTYNGYNALVNTALRFL
jgi:Zn-dependent protease